MNRTVLVLVSLLWSPMVMLLLVETSQRLVVGRLGEPFIGFRMVV